MKRTICTTYDAAEKLWYKLWHNGRDVEIISARDGTGNWIVLDHGVNKLKGVKG
jgi:hypothetical protein